VALKVSKRGLVPPFIVMDVLRAANERQAAGEDVLHLELGQPGTPAPRGAIEAAQAALEADQLGYTEAFGLAALRARIAEFYDQRYGVAVDAERIVVTTGSSGGFVLSFLAAFDPGDRVALADPSYPAYRNILLALGIEPVSLPAGPETRYQPSIELIERVGGALDGLIVASPANPSGTMLEADELKTLAEYCRGRGIRLISDEIYHGITYLREAATALAHDERAVVINSFSKYFSMTGWRIGWMVAPDDLMRSIECLKQNLFISAPTLSQHAALAALDCTEELDGNVARYARNRALLLDRLPAAGFDRLAPAEGAFYLYADVSHLTNDSETFCREMLDQTGVATAPGIDFDQARGRAHLRISYAGPTAEIEAAVARLADWRRRG
jgi:aspartate/methionine/tyrosine aminotransferase